MNWLEWLSVVGFSMAAWPAYQFTLNFGRYRKLDPVSDSEFRASILIPARNEEFSIADCVRAGLSSKNVNVEVIVLDDHSTDRTAEIVTHIAKQDSRVRLLAGTELHPGWAGKQFACQQLGNAARNEYLIFIDADVLLTPDAVTRMIQFQRQTECGLITGVPFQITKTWLEKLVIPLIHFLLLCYLPMGRMRKLRLPALGAGCGQLFLTTRTAYDQVGGHETIKSSFHDGVKLPRAYRRAGLWTDLFDATDVASCRMYHSAHQLWNGLAKNAGEGIGSPVGIWTWTILLVGGHVLPLGLLPFISITPAWAGMLIVVAVILSYFPRVVSAICFRQSWLGVVFHPFGIMLLLSIQWYALARRLIGQPIGWKGRVQTKG